MLPATQPLSSFLADHEVIQYGSTIWSVWVSCLGLGFVPSQYLVCSWITLDLSGLSTVEWWWNSEVKNKAVKHIAQHLFWLGYVLLIIRFLFYNRKHPWKIMCKIIVQGMRKFHSQGERKPWRCASAAQQQCKQWHVISSGLVTDPNPGTIWASMKKMNSKPLDSPFKIMGVFCCYLFSF